MIYPYGTSSKKALYYGAANNWELTTHPWNAFIPQKWSYTGTIAGSDFDYTFVSDPTKPGPVHDSNSTETITSAPVIVGGAATYTEVAGVRTYNHVGLDPYSNWENDEDWILTFAAIARDSIHTGGTCALGKAIGTDFKVKQTTNIRVSDLSVFPSHVQANTQGWAMQVGRYVGDVILGNITPPVE